MVSFPDKNHFVKVFKNEFFCPNQGPSRFLLGGQYLEGSFFLVEIGESWKKIGTNTILDERGYVSSGLEFTNNLKKIESGWFLSQIKIIL